jgi:hypothetical protein
MNNPPLYVELTNSETGEQEGILLGRLHSLREFTDTQNLRSGTIIRTWNELGALSPQGIIVSYCEMQVREKKAEIYKKIQTRSCSITKR